jgi:hypothetical protein
MRPLALMIGLIGAAILPYQCGAQILDDFFSEYFERSVTIAPSAGNAKDANAAIHTIDPWPPYVGDTRIPRDGRAAVNSIERMYRNPVTGVVSSGSGATGSSWAIQSQQSGGALAGLGAGLGTGSGSDTGGAGTPPPPGAGLPTPMLAPSISSGQ